MRKGRENLQWLEVLQQGTAPACPAMMRFPARHDPFTLGCLGGNCDHAGSC